MTSFNITWNISEEWQQSITQNIWGKSPEGSSLFPLTTHLDLLHLKKKFETTHANWCLVCSMQL